MSGHRPELRVVWTYDAHRVFAVAHISSACLNKPSEGTAEVLCQVDGRNWILARLPEAEGRKCLQELARIIDGTALPTADRRFWGEFGQWIGEESNRTITVQPDADIKPDIVAVCECGTVLCHGEEVEIQCPACGTRHE